jgi:oligoendopeptidase F
MAFHLYLAMKCKKSEVNMNKRIFYLIVYFSFIGWICAEEGPFGNLPPVNPDAHMVRSAVPSVYKWNLKDLCPSDEQWSKELAQFQKDLHALKNRDMDLETAKGLEQYLTVYFKLDDQINRLTLYANLQRDVEATNQEVIARHELALNFTEEVMQEGAKLRQTILAFSPEEIEKALKDESNLAAYLPYIKRIRRRADRILSPVEERLLSMAGDNLWAQIDLNELPSPMEKAFLALRADMTLPVITDADGKEVPLSFANYGYFRGSPDRNVRRQAVAALFNTLKGLQNTFATTLGEQAQFSLFLSRARGYETVLEAYLDKDNITPDVYMNLITTVHAHVEPLHKYVALRKKALGFDEIHLYDLYVPMVEQLSMEIDYNTGAQYILNALEPLGEAYLNQLRIGMDPRSGWIDLYPSKNKNSGAFSAATYSVHPYVKMNFQNRFNDVSTLAHEYGHAMHSFYAMSSQSYLSWRYVPFLAEIASTCNEMLLSRYLIDKAESDQEKAWLLSELLETIRTTIYRQTLFAEFELNLHQLAEAGEPITAAKLNEIYSNLLRIYYGPDYNIDQNDHIEWAYIPHFYYKYYLFTYATGLSAGIALAEKVIDEGPQARDAYLGMLKGGSSKPPLDLLRDAGVDLTKPEAVESALKLFDETVDELEILLDK